MTLEQLKDLLKEVVVAIEYYESRTSEEKPLEKEVKIEEVEVDGEVIEVENEVVNPFEEDKKLAPEEMNREYLEGLGYRDIQDIAKEYGVAANQSKVAIIDELVGEPSEEDIEKFKESLEETEDIKNYPEEEVEEVEEEVEEEQEQESEEEVVSKEELEDVEVEPNEMDRFAEVLSGYTDDELRDLLEQLEMSQEGKRQSLLAKLYKAYKSGSLEIDMPEEETESAEEIESTEEEEELPPIDVMRGVVEHVDEVDLAIEDISEKEIVERYLGIVAALVDDNGDKVELAELYVKEGAYACCGDYIGYLDESEESLFCPKCGQEYEI